MIFHYKAVDFNGNFFEGTTIAVDKLSAEKKILKKNLTAIKINQSITTERISRKKIAEFSSQLSHLLEAGLLLYDSLVVLREQFCGEILGCVIEDICDVIHCGESFSDSLKRYRQYFPDFYISMIKVGEQSGNLATTLRKINILLEKREAITKKVFTSLAYPIFLAIFASISFVIMMTMVIPQVEPFIPKNSDKILTRITLFISHLIREQYVAISSLILCLTLAITFLMRNKNVKNACHSLILKMPIIGMLIKYNGIVSSFFILSILLKGGVNLVKSLSATTEAVSNKFLKIDLLRSKNFIENGQKFSEGFKNSQFASKIILRLISLGEESGSFENVFAKIAEIYECHLDKYIATITNVIGPMMLVIMGIVIGFMVMGLIAPLTDCSNFVID